MGREDDGAKQSHDYRDGFNHFTHPSLTIWPTNTTRLFQDGFINLLKWFRDTPATQKKYAVGLEMSCPGGACNWAPEIPSIGDLAGFPPGACELAHTSGYCQPSICPAADVLVSVPAFSDVTQAHGQRTIHHGGLRAGASDAVDAEMKVGFLNKRDAFARAGSTIWGSQTSGQSAWSIVVQPQRPPPSRAEWAGRRNQACATDPSKPSMRKRKFGNKFRFIRNIIRVTETADLSR
jgi:hypothetical protein